MVKLHDKATGRYLGEVTEEELQFLIENLEEESLTDVDYYINETVLESLKEKGMSETLARLLESAMGDKGEAEIRYEREESEAQ
ncbi:MAG: galactosyldiacylglycerol synthase [bacterium]|nr:galactosyldiacylglycerol synthase [bacterium]